MTQITIAPRHSQTPAFAGPSYAAGKSREADRFWPVLRDLIEARSFFGLRRPVLATLRALISFLEEGSVVFASNRSITARAEGISESALRRHIKTLVDLGLVARRDSSNGKRYRIEAQGQEEMVFGLDLAPLAAARDQIAEAAERCREENRMIRYLKRQLGQLIFHARSLGRPEAEIQPYQNALRQKLSSEAYARLCAGLSPEVEAPQTPVSITTKASAETGAETAVTSKMTARDSQNDCHKNITKERILDSVEAAISDHAAEAAVPKPQPDPDPAPRSPAASPADPSLLRKAKALAPDALAFAEEAPQNWEEVESLAWRLASWSGISPRLLSQAIEAAGQRMTAMAVLTVTQNAGRIRNPGAYFRTLTMGRHFPRFARPLAHLN